MTTGRINQVASSRDAAPQQRRCECASAPGGASTVEQKLGDQTSFANPTKSIGTAAFTWVHEHSCVRRFEHTGVRLSGRENADARLRPPVPAIRPRVRRRVSKGLYIKRPNKAAGGPSAVKEGKTRRDDGSSGRKAPLAHVQRAPLRAAAPVNPPRRCPDQVHGEANKGATAPAVQIKIGRGAPNGPERA
ncbi:hypothetical protein H6P81_021318 [Aristolochia fimbriata]|uniref:Uncharacterized protein n=1 Tax=Aristolochia fimbriata TaxID=158543 RepID=A0AAV7DUT5_ARIFI|nr:hypothetical protein H6P81_021318 [Aristolochia fimbriata]